MKRKGKEFYDIKNFTVSISDEELQKKFGISRRSAFTSRKILKKNGFLNYKKEKKSGFYKTYKVYSIPVLKYIRVKKGTYIYQIRSKSRGEGGFDIPLTILYDRTLSHSEKSAIIWIQFLKTTGEKITLQKLADFSNISYRTLLKSQKVKELI
jgi:hypothetical protein